MRDAKLHPWILGPITIAERTLAQVDDEARAAYARDEESCGLLAGPVAQASLVDEIFPMQNRATALHALDPEAYPRSGRTSFDIDPLKFGRALKEGEANGRPVKVLYHSHPDVGAYFSDTDAAAALMGGTEPSYDLAYLVTSVRAGTVDDHKLFVWDPETRSFAQAEMLVSRM